MVTTTTTTDGGQAQAVPNNPNLGSYGNGWCWAIPEEAGYFGQTHVINPRYQLYFAGETNLGYVGNDYYFYYMNNYVEANIANLEGLNTDRNQWQVGVDSTWATGNEPWWRYEANWRVDYRCN